MPLLTLIRGAPGSGKSTLASKITMSSPNTVHYEADMFRMKNGVYVFNVDETKEVHAQCQGATAKAIKLGHNVVVSNTFTKFWEIQPYLTMTDKIQVIKCEGRFQNIHNVPDAIIERMRQQYEPY